MASPAETLYARGFAADGDTERALRAGLAGHRVEIQRGRVTVALRTLATEPAAKLVFVDLDGHPAPEMAAKELTGVCAYGTALIAIGSTDSADVLRALLRCGLADYLVKPITATLVREASASAMDHLPRRTYAGRMVAFVGSAGSGTSTLVASVARDVATRGRTASVVDLDPVLGKLSGVLGTPPAGDLPALLATLGSQQENDAVSSVGAEGIDSVCASAAPGISLIAFAHAGRSLPEPSAAAACALARHLANRTHLVLVTGTVDPDAQSEIMRQADARVLVFEPTLTSISSAVRWLALLGPEYPSILVQCAPRMRRPAMSSAHVRYALADRRPDIVVPFERALSTGTPAARLGKAYRRAVRQVTLRAIEGTVDAVT